LTCRDRRGLRRLEGIEARRAEGRSVGGGSWMRFGEWIYKREREGLVFERCRCAAEEAREGRIDGREARWMEGRKERE